MTEREPLDPRPSDPGRGDPGVSTHREPAPDVPTATEPQVVVVRERSWGAKIVMVLLALALLAMAGLFASLWLPTWWADQVSAVVNDRISVGILAGVVLGLVCTAIPLGLLRRTFGLHAGITSRVLALIVAAVVAAPNLTTLAIELGDTETLRSARTALDNAPGFRTASLVGAVIGALMVLVGWSLMIGRRRRSRRIERLEAQVRERDERLHRESEARRAGEDARLERERAAQDEAEHARLDQDRMDQDRMDQDRMDQDRIDQDRIDQDRLEQQRAQEHHREA